MNQPYKLLRVVALLSTSGLFFGSFCSDTIIAWFNGGDIYDIGTGIETEKIEEEVPIPPTNSILEDLGPSTYTNNSALDTTAAYALEFNGTTLFVYETNLDLGEPGGTVTWSVNVVERNVENGRTTSFVPSAGSQVAAELRDVNNTQELSGITGVDGWVHWTTPEPTIDTSFFITDISGSYPWGPSDQAFAADNSALSYKWTQIE